MGDRDDEVEAVETVPFLRDQYAAEEGGEIWIETKKLWRIVGPAIFTRISTNMIFVITQAFAGHLGELELAATSIVMNVIIGFTYSLMLGMASALETLCGQAYGAKKYGMLGVYMQRSWIVLFLFSILLLPMYLFASPILKFFGQPDDIAELSGTIAVWGAIPIHFAFAFVLPINRFLQCQLENNVLAITGGVTLVVHILACWLFVYGLKLGVIGTMTTVSVSWWLNVFILFTYIIMSGRCSLTWTGFSIEAFTELWEYAKLSASSGIMLCLEYWYYKILIVMVGNLDDAKIAVDSLSICMSINSLEMMIPLAFFAGAGIRVASELGAGNGKGAKFAMIISVTQSLLIGLIFSVLIVFLIDQIGWIFSSSETVLKAVNDLSILLAFTILLNSVQPVLSGVAVGSGWQSFVAYINLGCYYFIGLPLGFVIGWIFKSGIKGIWAGMIFGGTAIQTLILIFITMNCDWEKEVLAITGGVTLVIHILLSWLFVYGLKLGIIGTMTTVSVSWWLNVFILLTYIMAVVRSLGPVSPLKLSPNYGNMLSSLPPPESCFDSLEFWYYKILILMTRNLDDAKIAVDALSICMSINGLEMMIPLAFFAGAGIRVANELGAGNGKGAKFAMIISVTQSLIIGLIFSVLIVFLINQISWIFSSSETVIKAVNDLSILLAFTILLNSVQPVLSGVAVGSGWQSFVAYINLGCCYFIGLPLGFVIGWVFKSGIKGIWAGMIFGGTAIQTLILIFITMNCDWEKEVQKANVRVKKWTVSDTVN